MITPQWLKTRGGPTTYVVGLQAALQRRGVVAHVLSSDLGSGAARYRSGLFAREWDILRTLWRMMPDIIHIHGRLHLLPIALVYRALRRRKCKVVFTLHTQPFVETFLPGAVGQPDYSGLGLAVARWLLHSTDAVVSVCQDIVDNLNRHYGMNLEGVTIIASGGHKPSVNDEVRGQLQTALRLQGQHPILTSIGVLSWDWKVAGHLICIRAIKRLTATYPATHLLIVGDGPLRSVLEEAVVHEGLEGRVTLLGDRGDVAVILSVTDCYLHMGLNEGMPHALVEAAFAGLPIVAVNRGGLPEFIRNGENGVLVSADPTNVAQEVAALMSDHSRRERLAINAAAVAQDQYTWGAVAGRHVDLYESLR